MLIVLSFNFIRYLSVFYACSNILFIISVSILLIVPI